MLFRTKRWTSRYSTPGFYFAALLSFLKNICVLPRLTDRYSNTRVSITHSAVWIIYFTSNCASKWHRNSDEHVWIFRNSFNLWEGLENENQMELSWGVYGVSVDVIPFTMTYILYCNGSVLGWNGIGICIDINERSPIFSSSNFGNIH